MLKKKIFIIYFLFVLNFNSKINEKINPILSALFSSLIFSSFSVEIVKLNFEKITNFLPNFFKEDVENSIKKFFLENLNEPVTVEVYEDFLKNSFKSLTENEIKKIKNVYYLFFCTFLSVFGNFKSIFSFKDKLKKLSNKEKLFCLFNSGLSFAFNLKLISEIEKKDCTKLEKLGLNFLRIVGGKIFVKSFFTFTLFVYGLLKNENKNFDKKKELILEDVSDNICNYFELAAITGESIYSL